MRSNDRSMIRFLLRQNMFVGVIVFLVTFFLLPYWGLAHIPGEMANVLRWYNTETQPGVLSRLVSLDVWLSMDTEKMVVLFGGLGFLSAVLLSRHLFSRRQGMLHAALPVRRETDFLQRLTAYAVLVVAPIALNLLVYLAVVLANGLLGYVAWDTLLGRLGPLMLINLYGFAMGLLAGVLTGTWWAALLAGAVLIIGMEGLFLLWIGLAARYLHTIVPDAFTDALMRISPCASLYKGFYAPADFAWVSGVLATAAALGLSFALWRVRRTEAAEKTLAFPWLHTVMGLILPLMGGSILGLIFYLSFGTELSLILGMVGGAAFTYWVCRIVFNQRFCGILKQWYLPAGAALILLAGVAVLHTDALGFDHYMPERSQITAITYHPRSYHTEETVTLSSPDALDAAYDWCLLMRDEVDAFPDGINALMNQSSAVEITYHMGGRQVRRVYANETVRNAAQPSLRVVIESDDYRRSILQVSGLDGDVTSLYMNSRSYSLSSSVLRTRFGTDFISLSSEQDGAMIRSLVTALRQDVMTRTLDEKQQDEILTLSVCSKDPATGAVTYCTMPIYPGDTEFLRTAFGEQADDIIAYATGGYAAEESTAVLKVTFAESLGEMDRIGGNVYDLAQSITPASGPEEAEAWARSVLRPAASRYYFMPDLRDESHSRLYIYELSLVEDVMHMLPEDPAALFRPDVPQALTLNFVGR